MTASNITWCAASVIFVLLVSTLIPVFSLVMPLPFLFYASKLGLNDGIKTGFFSLLIVGIATKIIGGFPSLLLMCLVYGIAGVIISEVYRRNFSFPLTIFWGTILVFFLGAVIIFMLGSLRGMSPVEMITNDLQLSINKFIELVEQRDNNQDVIIPLKELGPALVELVKRIYPSLFILGAGFMVWLNVVLSRPLFINKGIRYPEMGPSDLLKAPENLVWAVIAAGFPLILSIKFIEFIALNALIVFFAVYVFYGFSILLFFFNRYNVPPWMRTVFYIIIFLQQFFLIALALAGLFDQWVDFRKINKNKKSEAE